MTAPQTFPPDTVPYPPVATRLPWTGLLALAMAGFITILTEALPAGLMPQMSQGLGVSEALVGQLVTLYALGSLLAAIPLTLLTQGWRRRPLLMIAIGGFAVVNLVTALSTSYPLTLVARFCAGVFAGLVWALLAGYAARMVAPELKGRAIAVAMVGTPVALTIGIPAGTLLGTLAGWQASFVVMSVLTLALLVWVRIKVPDFPGQQATTRLSLKAVLQLPGVPAVLIATLGFVLAHNLLYTYIAPLLAPSGLDARIGMVLLLFGAAALAGITLIGALIDRWLRELTLLTSLLFIVACVVWALGASHGYTAYAMTLVWGLAFGGAATLLQTACAKAGERGADVAQAMLVTTWNLGIAGGGLMGGVLLHSQGVSSLPWVAALLLLVVWATVLQARRAGFQSLRAAATGADR
jgi:predicted MFS family arabinose efflux permease